MRKQADAIIQQIEDLKRTSRNKGSALDDARNDLRRGNYSSVEQARKVIDSLATEIQQIGVTITELYAKAKGIHDQIAEEQQVFLDPSYVGDLKAPA
jgi:hypothetical protein